MNAKPSIALLTSREIEVLEWTADGKTAVEVAEVMQLAEETIRTHIKSACRKLNATNKTHAIALALSWGVLKVTIRSRY